MRDGWHCPSCNRVNAPDMAQCPCSPVLPMAPVKPIILNGYWCGFCGAWIAWGVYHICLNSTLPPMTWRAGNTISEAS